nr:MAG TPA: hypothetical protein [Caudoviricetes sp.]
MRAVYMILLLKKITGKYPRLRWPRSLRTSQAKGNPIYKIKIS